MKDRIEKTIDLAAPVSRVWLALTDHLQFEAWFRAEISGPFVEGARLQGVSTIPDNECVSWEMMVMTMEPERLFSFTWQDTPQENERSSEPATLVTFELEANAGGTHLTIIESGFAALSDKHRSEMFRENTPGWNMQAANIAAYLNA